MPLVTLTLRQARPAALKTAILDATHAALVGTGVHPQDRFQRVLELAEDDFRFDPLYPDLASARTDDFALVEILLGVGRSPKVKKQILAGLVQELSKRDVNPEHVMVCFQETAWENWSAGGGRMLHA